MKPTVPSFICILWGNECISVHIQNSEPTGDQRLGSKDSVIRRQVVGRLRLCLPSILGIFLQPNVLMDLWALMRISEEAVTRQLCFFKFIIPMKKYIFQTTPRARAFSNRMHTSCCENATILIFRSRSIFHPETAVILFKLSCQILLANSFFCISVKNLCHGRCWEFWSKHLGSKHFAFWSRLFVMHPVCKGFDEFASY